jgi:hypothetical protein
LSALPFIVRDRLSASDRDDLLQGRGEGLNFLGLADGDVQLVAEREELAADEDLALAEGRGTLPPT